jgi:hypothetical protein
MFAWFRDDFGFYTRGKKFDDHETAKRYCDEKNLKIDSLGLESYGYWFAGPAQIRPDLRIHRV